MCFPRIDDGLRGARRTILPEGNSGGRLAAEREPGEEYEHGDCVAARHVRRRRTFTLPGRNPPVPDAGTERGIHAGQALARAWRPRCGP
nr:hypothetical protein [Bosea sp. WAO]